MADTPQEEQGHYSARHRIKEAEDAGLLAEAKAWQKLCDTEDAHIRSQQAIEEMQRKARYKKDRPKVPGRSVGAKKREQAMTAEQRERRMKAAQAGRQKVRKEYRNTDPLRQETAVFKRRKRRNSVE